VGETWLPLIDEGVLVHGREEAVESSATYFQDGFEVPVRAFGILAFLAQHSLASTDSWLLSLVKRAVCFTFKGYDSSRLLTALELSEILVLPRTGCARLVLV
jgi:hypothetical protein